MRHKPLIITGYFLFFITGCSSNNANKNILYLTGNKGLKYWDLIYSTDINNKSQSILKRNGLAKTCISFQPTGRVMHYNCVDSLNLIDSGCNTDIAFNPDKFTLETDSIIYFSGRKYIIETISTNFIILKFGNNRTNRATVIYTASRIQNKNLLRCK